MKIRMLVSLAGLDFALSPGDETERFAAKEAKRMIAAGHAILVVKEKVERTSRRPAAETR